MILYHPIVILVKASSSLFLNQLEDHQLVDLIIYQQLVGKLIYLSCRTYLDIVFIIGQLKCHNLDLQSKQLQIAK